MTSKRRDSERQQSKLEFDPPLSSPSPAAGEPEPLVEPPDLGSLPLFPELDPPEEELHEPLPRPGPDREAQSEPAESESAETEGQLTRPSPAGAPVGDDPRGVTLRARFLAGLADVAIHGAVVVVLVAGQVMLTSSPPTLAQLPAYCLFLLAFSFLYSVVPLAFWGQTPGMSVLGLQVRAADGQNLTFPQTAARWAAGLLTCALLGAPLLLALSGGSLGDRLSRSVTVALDG